MHFLYTFLTLSLASTQTSAPPQTKTINIPKSLDWRSYKGTNYLASFKPEAPNAKCDSSWAILVASTLSDRLKILRQGKSPDIQLSSQFLLSCVDNSKGCSGGDIIESFIFILNNAIFDDSILPYQGRGKDNGLTCDQLQPIMSCGNDKDCKDSEFYFMFGISSYQKVIGVEQIVDALQTGPIVCRILKDEGFAEYKAGIYSSDRGGNGSYGYLSIVGYGSADGAEFWIGRSAYGSKWGEKGFIRLAKGKNVLKVENYCASAVPNNLIKIISKDNQAEVYSKDANEISFEDYNSYSKKENCSQDTNKTSHEKFIPFDESQYFISKPKHRFLLVFGPSQSGKSTFINNLLKFANSKLETAKVGKNIGKSTTIKVGFYNVGNIHALFKDDIQNYDNFTLIDVPGLFDSDMRISKEEIFDAIKHQLFDYGVNSLDAILMFESVKDDSRKVYQTMGVLQEYFGKEVHSSTIVLSTKWDKIDDEDKEGIETYLDSMVKTIQVKSMKWQNNYGEKLIITNREMHSQLDMLGQLIKESSPYKVEGLNNLLMERDELAKQIRENDPNRYALTNENRTEYIPEEFIKEIEVETHDLVKLTNEEIELRSQQLYDSQIPIPGGLIPDPSGKRNILKRKVKIPKIIQKSYTLKTGWWIFGGTHEIPYQEITWEDGEEEIDLGPLMINADDKKLPIHYFKELVRNEAKFVPVIKKILMKDIRYKKIDRIIMKNQEKHSFEYYQKLASEQLSRNFIEFIRNNSNN